MEITLEELPYDKSNLMFQALMWAACRGHIRVVHALLEGGADANKQCGDGSKAVDLAAVNGQDQVNHLNLPPFM